MSPLCSIIIYLSDSIHFRKGCKQINFVHYYAGANKENQELASRTWNRAIEVTWLEHSYVCCTYLISIIFLYLHIIQWWSFSMIGFMSTIVSYNSSQYVQAWTPTSIQQWNTQVDMHGSFTIISKQENCELTKGLFDLEFLSLQRVST